MALLRIHQGRYDQAIGHLTEAANLWQQLGATASQARTPTGHAPHDNRPAPSNSTTLAPGT
jgi:hypothetical protein